jgi:hypothetical protein
VRWFFIAILALGACTKIEDAVSGAPQQLRSSDGSLEITVPGSWKVDKLNDQATIQAANRMAELYVIVLSEPKDDFADMTLQKYSEATRSQQLKSMKSGAEEGPTARTLNGLPAIEYVLRGSVDGANVVMKHVAVDGTKRFHQVLVWTLKSKWDAEQATLDAVVASLKETNGKP